MRKFHIISIAILIMSFLSNSALSQISNDESSTVKQLVIDNANVLSNNDIALLTNKLNKFSRETSTQILVYTTLDLNGYNIADYGQRLGERLGVGQDEFNNGIVIVFKPKVGNNPGRVTIQTGYGIEALIPDATANQIINNEMIPAFKQGSIISGINNAVDICMALTKEEFTAEQYQEQTSGSGFGGVIILIIFAVTFLSMFRKSSGSYNSGSRSSLPLFAAIMLMGSGSSRGSGFGDFSSGSGSFGGGSSFGGFGGGGFGGGGASGSW